MKAPIPLRVLMLLDNPCAPDWRVQREAAALQHAGATVLVLCWDRDGRPPAIEDLDGVRIERLRTPSGRNLGIRQVRTLLTFYRAAWRRLREEPIDIVHVHDLPLLVLGIAVARRRKVNLIYDAHEIYHFMEAGKYPRSLLGALALFEGWLVRRYVTTLITVSQQRVTDYWQHVAGSTPTVVVGNWYDPADVTKEQQAAARLELGLGNGPCVVYAGGLAPERRLDLLVSVARQRPDLTVLVAGRGSSDVERLLSAANDELPNVHYMGWVDRPELLYRAASALYYVLDPHHPYSRFAASNTLHLALAHRIPLITGLSGEPGAVMTEIAPDLVLKNLTAANLHAALDWLSQHADHDGLRSRLHQRHASDTWQHASAALLDAYHLAGARVTRPATEG